MNTEKDRPRFGIYLLPNLLTTLNLFCGFYAVIAAINNDFATAAVAIVIAAVFDALDGKIARLTHTTSRFGVEYDSLADLVSFGMAPALLMYLWCLKPLGRLGWLGAFLFMACGALRLARFNVQSESSSGDHFSGLPIPGGAGMIAATVMFCHHVGLANAIHPIVFLIMIYGLAFLMVSTIRYNSFKHVESLKRMNFNLSVAALLILIFIAAQPAIALFICGLTYVASGPLIAMRRNRMPDQESDFTLEEKEPVKPAL